MSINPFTTIKEDVATSTQVADEVKTSTCYMCACRCGIRVYLKNGKVRFIEGNPDHPINKGVLCAKGSAGIMQHYSPARLTAPLLRVGERGEGKFKEISWEEALSIATGWLAKVRSTNPNQLAFFTGRDQSQSLTGWWSQQYGSINHAAHGGFCSVNMAAAGLYTIGGSFWEFGEVDWEHTRYFMMFGVAEDHDSNPIKMGLGKLKNRENTRFVSVNPVRTGYSAIADEWVGIRPGTDGLFVFSLIHELLKAEKIDWQYLVRYTNAHWLVIQEPGASDHGLFLRDRESTRPLCYDSASESLVDASSMNITPAFVGNYESAEGRKVVPAFQLFTERFLQAEYAPDAVADETGVSAEQIKGIAADLARVAFEEEIELDVKWTDSFGRQQDKMIGRPVAMHAMRGISAHSNGFHTCRAIHLLQILLGSIDVPGGFRYKPPFPKPIPPAQKPAGDTEKTNTPLGSMPLGFPAAPGDLRTRSDGSPQRIDKAFSWEYPLSIHGMMHMVIHNAWKADPYPIDTLFMYMANMAWNSSMNVPDTIRYLTDINEETGEYKIPRIIYSDAYYSETVPYADLILPDTTYLERWDCISLLDRPICDADGAADAIRQPVVPVDRNVRPFQDVLLELGARLGLPGMVRQDGTARFSDYADYIANHMRTDRLGPLAGWRGVNGESDLTGPANPDQLQHYIDNGCFWRHELTPSQRYYKFANRDYLDFAQKSGWIGSNAPIVLQLYSEPMQRFRLAAEGHGYYPPPLEHRERIKKYFDPLPLYYPPFSSTEDDTEEYPLHALSQRPMHMYHSWGSQNAWLRQITNVNYLHIHHDLALSLDLEDEDWAWLCSSHARVKVQIKRVHGVNPDTVWTWNAIGKRKGSWGLDEKAPESNQGFLLNHIISELLPPRTDGYRYSNSDPVTGQAAWFDLRVKLEKCRADECGQTEPQFDTLPAQKEAGTEQIVLRYGEELKDKATSTDSGNTLKEHREFVTHPENKADE
ncbi:MAG: molybdopterin-dependent oxidoreductase [Gammaproteobacteria bacterium]|nr:molybdopterin-dependent oxidoreductase [Gammaproteobacteria bacterium]